MSMYWESTILPGLTMRLTRELTCSFVQEVCG